MLLRMISLTFFGRGGSVVFGSILDHTGSKRFWFLAIQGVLGTGSLSWLEIQFRLFIGWPLCGLFLWPSIGGQK